MTVIKKQIDRKKARFRCVIIYQQNLTFVTLERTSAHTPIHATDT